MNHNRFRQLKNFLNGLLAKYELMSLSEATGLMLPDIDDACLIPSIEIRNNALRETLKTPTRSRRQPIHPELIRLGFLDCNCSGGVISPGFRALFLGCVGLADVSQPHCDAPA